MSENLTTRTLRNGKRIIPLGDITNVNEQKSVVPKKPRTVDVEISIPEHTVTPARPEPAPSSREHTFGVHSDYFFALNSTQYHQCHILPLDGAQGATLWCLPQSSNPWTATLLNNDEPPAVFHHKIDADGLDEVAEELFRSLKVTEVAMMPDAAYLTNHPNLSTRKRLLLVDFLIHLSRKLHVTQHSVFLAASVVDRYFSCCSRQINQASLISVGLAAMMVSLKFEERDKYKISDLMKHTRAVPVCKAQIVQSETVLLAQLNWQVSVPTIHSFLPRYLQASRVTPVTSGINDMVHRLAHCTCERAMLEYNSLRHAPSKIAAAGVFVARLLCLTRRARGCAGVLLTHSSRGRGMKSPPPAPPPPLPLPSAAAAHCDDSSSACVASESATSATPVLHALGGQSAPLPVAPKPPVSSTTVTDSVSPMSRSSSSSSSSSFASSSSSSAAAGVLSDCSSATVSLTSVWPASLSHITGYTAAELQDCVQMIRQSCVEETLLRHAHARSLLVRAAAAAAAASCESSQQGLSLSQSQGGGGGNSQESNTSTSSSTSSSSSGACHCDSIMTKYSKMVYGMLVGCEDLPLNVQCSIAIASAGLMQAQISDSAFSTVAATISQRL